MPLLISLSLSWRCRSRLLCSCLWIELLHSFSSSYCIFPAAFRLLSFDQYERLVCSLSSSELTRDSFVGSPDGASARRSNETDRESQQATQQGLCCLRDWRRESFARWSQLCLFRTFWNDFPRRLKVICANCKKQWLRVRALTIRIHSKL